MTSSQDPVELRERIDQERTELADTAAELAARLDVPARAKEGGRQVVEQAKATLEEAKVKVEAAVADARVKAQPVIDQAKVKAQPMIEQARVKARPMVEQARVTAGPMVEQARQQASERRPAVIAGAIGTVLAILVLRRRSKKRRTA